MLTDIKKVFQYESHNIGKGFIMVIRQHVKTKSTKVVNIYALCNMQDNVALWESTVE